MKKMLWMLLAAALILGSCAKAEQEPVKAVEKAAEVSVDTVKAASEAYFAEYPGSRIIPADKVFAAIDANEDFLIVDIRRAEDYANGHLKGAVNAPWGPALADALNWLPDDIPVYVNCYTGQTAGQTVAVLNIAGIQAQSIKSGWNLGISKTEGYENYVETTENMTPDASGVKYDAAVKTAAENFFNAIPDKGSNIIASSALKEKMDAEEEMTIVSIRQPDAYSAGHIEGAINIPFGKDMQKQFAQLPKDEKVYVYCYSGQTAGQTVGVLRMLGYDAVSIKSGMGNAGTAGSGWEVEGNPVVQ
ncbi:rhodanese-like domain-containing protein [Spirochaeta isovalerica]|uniref:Rhodanese-related sulfurtransferase n=1 Tax=Spirochaeta isovalerica TaxID=150 RepID=A0A841R7F8_9SPIO|nr:rhodanese-like domain-containing protein [Spirochaeta isovalerica]MBB6479783.1 rhodanese-related sulfurtransferase [Spirochaeta isovalerica]